MGQDLQRRWFAAAVAAVMVSLGAPSAHAQQATVPPLYERLGGLRGITVVVDDFINRLVANRTLNKNPAIDAGRKHSPPPYLKYQVSQLVCEVTGGPCKYTGRPLKEGHSHLNISEKEWGVMAAEFKKSLARYKVAAREQNELFDIIGSTKGDIVTRP